MRHRAGKAPVVRAPADASEHQHLAQSTGGEAGTGTQAIKPGEAAAEDAASRAAAEEIRKRLQARLQEDAAAAQRRAELLSKILAKPVLASEAAIARSSSSPSESESESEGSELERRAQLRAKILAQRGLEEQAAQPVQDSKPAQQPSALSPPRPSSSEEDEEEESSGESEDSESEDDLPRPIFISQQNRSVIKDQAALQREREEAERAKAETETRKHQEAVRVLRAAINEEASLEARKARKAEETLHGVIANMPDDTDGLDEEGEFDAWKAREFARLERELDVTGGDDELDDDDDTRGKATGEEDSTSAGAASKPKHHHRGAFFMSDDKISQAVRSREKGEALLARQGLLSSQADKRAAMKKAPEVVKVRGPISTASTVKPTASDESDDAGNEDDQYLDHEM